MINLLFFTVTFKFNKIPTDTMVKEALQYERFKQIKEENAVKAIRHGYFM